MALLGKLTLQKRIGLLILAALAVSISLFSWVGVQSVNESVEKTLDERLTVARVIASRLDQTLQYVLVQLQDIDFSEGLPNQVRFRQEADSLRDTLSRSGIYTSNIFLVDIDGKLAQTEPEDAKSLGLDMSRYPELKQALDSGTPTISGLVASPFTGASAVLISVPVCDSDGGIRGILTSAIDIESSSLGTFGQAITVGKTGYIEIVDGNGIVIARTKPGTPPEVFERSDHPGRFADLIKNGQATVSTCHRCHETAQQVQRRKDVLAFAPLSVASWGVAIRQSEDEALAPSHQLERRLILFGLILMFSSFLLMWLMIQSITRPIKMLTVASKRVATGDFKLAAPVKRSDEIGELSAAFSTMTQELCKSRDELVSRNRELSALNSIAATVDQSLNLQDVLLSALQKVLEVTSTGAGCVFLKETEGSKLVLMTSVGSMGASGCPESASLAGNCACHQVLRRGQTLMVNDISQCPRLGQNPVTKDVNCFVCVPLKSKDKTLGIMNVACSGESHFTEMDFNLLNSIGYHVGLAVENAILYEEAKQKEKLRGQLLSRVITAQEEERKRVARELHDEYGQTLTGLMMSIESLENAASPGKAELREKLRNAKTVVARALEELRRLTFDLRPSVLDDLGLLAAVRTCVQTHLTTRGIQVTFETKGLNDRLSPAVETTLFRIVQEATHNIIKHAGAHHVRLQLEVKNNKAVATVTDDGKGFDVDAVFKYRIGVQSLGLLGIQERATLLGGTFNVKSQVGQGTCLTVEIPLNGSSESWTKYKGTTPDSVELEQPRE